jgi:hypothetical protein
MTDAELIEAECDALKAMLLEKNKAYGSSALSPVRIFSKADTVEQIRVRIDDKLSRLMRGSAAGEDVVLDLIGYLVLLRIATKEKWDKDVHVAASPEVIADVLAEVEKPVCGLCGVSLLTEPVMAGLTPCCDETCAWELMSLRKKEVERNKTPTAGADSWKISDESVPADTALAGQGGEKTGTTLERVHPTTSRVRLVGQERCAVCGACRERGPSRPSAGKRRS